MPICKLCFKPIKPNSLYYSLNKECYLCKSCLKIAKPKFIHFYCDKYKGLAIYDYDEAIKSRLYQFKGCYDYELRGTFIQPFARELKLLYLGYYIVFCPSFIEDDKKRGFNHVKEIFSFLKLPKLDILEKTSNYKQADHNTEGRGEIKKHMQVNNFDVVNGKKILIVDDVFTTGSTMRAAIELILKGKPKKIKILVMSKTVSI